MRFAQNIGGYDIIEHFRFPMKLRTRVVARRCQLNSIGKSPGGEARYPDDPRDGNNPVLISMSALLAWLDPVGIQGVSSGRSEIAHN